jgi:hypothetical protein
MNAEVEEEPTEKVKITSQPIFLMAMVLVVFNVLLFLWSMNRDSAQEVGSGEVDQLAPKVEEAAH